MQNHGTAVRDEERRRRREKKSLLGTLSILVPGDIIILSVPPDLACLL